MTTDEAVYCMRSYLPGRTITTCKKCVYYGENEVNPNVYTCRSSEAHKMAIKALEKQIKIKPIISSAINLDIIRCPNCRSAINMYDRYCSDCGQAILWEE